MERSETTVDGVGSLSERSDIGMVNMQERLKLESDQLLRRVAAG